MNKNTYQLPRGEKIRRAMSRVFDRQRDAILRFVRTGKKAVGGLPPFWPDWDDFGLGALKLADQFAPLLQPIWEKTGDMAGYRLGLDPNSWSVINPHTEAMIQNQAFNFCDETNEATGKQLGDALDDLRSDLSEGIVDQGESILQLTKRVNHIFDGLSKSKARTIAQTETSRAVHMAQEQAAIDSGVVTGWRWLLSSDACPICHAIAARCPTVKLGQPFAIIGKNPTYATILGPPAHPRCNCTAVEILISDEQPEFHAALDQPEPATDQEIDAIGKREMARYEEIWKGSNKPWVAKPVKPRAKAVKPVPVKRPAPLMRKSRYA